MNIENFTQQAQERLKNADFNFDLHYTVEDHLLDMITVMEDAIDLASSTEDTLKNLKEIFEIFTTPR